MEDRLDKVEKRIIDLELKVSKLEGSFEHTEKRKKFPIFAILLLVSSVWLLFNWLPGLFFGYGYGSGGIFGGFNLFFVVIALALGWWGWRKFHEYREKAPSAEEEKEAGLIEEKPSFSELKEKVEAKKEPTGEKLQSFEFQIASHWFSIVGIVAIVIGVVFFLKFAFDNNLIGPVGQVSIGILLGLGLLGAGEYFRNKYQKYSQIITGGGVLVLYLSLWASFSVFHLVIAEVALAAMFLITLTAALLAIRYQAIGIVALGILGGFATPMLLVKGLDNQLLLMLYLVILNLGVLMIAFFQNWTKINVLSFIATYFVLFFWYTNYYKSADFWSVLVFLAILFLIYVLVYFIYNVLNKERIEETDVLLMLSNAAVYFGFNYVLFQQSYKDFLGFLALGLAAFYFLLGWVSFRLYKEDSKLTLGFLGISIVFLTLAVPLQVEKNVITLIWSLEALALLWAGFWINSYRLRVVALAVYLLVAGRLLLFDSSLSLSEFNLIANIRFVTFLSAAISLGAASAMYYKFRSKTVEDEVQVLPALLIALNVVLVGALSLESISYFDKQIENVRSSAKRISVGNTNVLGIQSISRTINGSFDDVSVTCSNWDNSYVYLGVDSACQPAQATSSRFLFKDISVPKNAKISGATFSVSPVDSHSDTIFLYLSVSRDAYSNEATRSASLSTTATVGPWVVGGFVALGTFLEDQVQELINSTEWQSGDDILVTADGIAEVQTNFRRVYAYETDPSKAARLTISYDTGETSYLDVDSSQYQNNQTPYTYTDKNRVNVSGQLDEAALKKIKSLESARDISLSIIWLGYSVAILAIGIVKKYKPIRVSALVFFGITILKVFLYDSRSLQLGYRIIAFIVLGVILLGVSLAYQKYKAKIEAFLLND